MIRITEIKVPLGAEVDAYLRRAIVKKLRIQPEELVNYRIYKKSVDARKKDMIHFVYIVDVEVRQEPQVMKRVKDPHVSVTPPLGYQQVPQGSQPLHHRPVVVGSGPAGLFAALLLAQRGYCPILLERGKEVEERGRDVDQYWNGGPLNPESNVQFGEGGAGTFSDGKLTTQIKDPRCRKVLEELVAAGAPQEIIYDSKPHVGTDYLRIVVKSLREKIIALGGEVRFQSKLTDLNIENQQLKALEVNGDTWLDAQVAVLALGHSARDTFEMIYQRGLAIEPKPFSIGVRIEHPQRLINESQYGALAEHPDLGAADYKLSYHSPNHRSAYTFCMCPGGRVVASASSPGTVVTNGMSYYARSLENANSALLVNVTPEDFPGDHPLRGMYFQQHWEEAAFRAGGSNGYAPAQLVADFLEDRPSRELGRVKPSYQPGVTLTDLRECLPDFVIQTLKEALVALDKKMKGFALGDAVMTGIETRSSSPIRILRNPELESNIRGIYPGGEGAGYAGGIISAAVDGLRIAEAIIQKYAPLN